MMLPELGVEHNLTHRMISVMQLDIKLSWSWLEVNGELPTNPRYRLTLCRKNIHNLFLMIATKLIVKI